MAAIINGRDADQATIDMNSQVMRVTVAVLVKRAGGKLVIRPEELAEMLQIDADLNFAPHDDGSIHFELKQVTQEQGIKLT